MKFILTVFCALFSIAATQLPKCSIYNSSCQKTFFQDVAGKYAPIGMPAIGIKPIEPFKPRTTVLPILGLWNVTFDGEAKGISSCVLTKYECDVKNRIKDTEMICDSISIVGRYKLTPNPIIMESCAPFAYGEGFLNLTLDKWFFRFWHPFRIVRHKDKKIYLKALFDEAIYEAEVYKKVTLEIDGVKYDNRDISDYIESFVNNNWSLLMNSYFGKFLNDESAEYFYEVYNKFYDRTPASEYLSDDLSRLVDYSN